MSTKPYFVRQGLRLVRVAVLRPGQRRERTGADAVPLRPETQVAPRGGWPRPDVMAPWGLTGNGAWDGRSTATAAAPRNQVPPGEEAPSCDVLRRLREDAGLTQREVACRLDMSRGYVSNLESGRSTRKDGVPSSPYLRWQYGKRLAALVGGATDVVTPTREPLP